VLGTQVAEPIENASPSTVRAAFYSLLDAVDSKSIAKNFEIGTYTAKDNFDNYLKVAIFEGVHPSDSLDELVEKTDTHDELTYLAGSTLSRLTNDRDYRAVVRLFFELLHSPQFYHQRSVQIKRLDWLERTVVATEVTNLGVSRSIKIASESDGTEVRRVIQPGKKGLYLNVTARVDGDAKQPLGVTITPGVIREPTQFEHHQSDVQVFAGLDSPIHVFDRGYLDYERFCTLRDPGDGLHLSPQVNTCGSMRTRLSLGASSRINPDGC
jgi:hypothetical protein